MKTGLAWDSPRRFTAFTILVCCMGLVACEPGLAGAPPTSAPTIGPATVEATAPAVSTALGSSGDYITASSIQELASKSSLIVIGQVQSVDGTFNLARDVNDTSQPDANVFEVGQIYQFQVDRYVSGAASDKVIYVVQPEGFVGPHGDKSDSGIATARAQDPHIKMRLGVEFMLFLQPHPKISEPGFSARQYYVGIAEPWRFDLSDPNRAVPESPWTGAVPAFGNLTEQQILDQISKPEATPIPTPGPTAYP